MKKTLAMLLAMLTLLSLLAGCAKEPEVTPDPTPAKPKEYVYHWLRSGEETTLNPHDSNASVNYDVNDKVCATLFKNYPNEDGTKGVLGPDLAAEMPTNPSGDGTTWIIKIDPNAKWHTGEPINARTVEYSWKMHMDPGLFYTTGATMAALFVNGTEYQQQLTKGTKVAWEDVGVKCLDDYTLELKTKLKYTPMSLAREFRLRACAPVYEPIYSKCISADGTSCDYGSSLDKIMFSGQFYISEWQKASQIVFEKNVNWNHADRIHITKIISRVVSDESTRLELFEKGEADNITLGTNGLAKYGEDPRVKESTSQTISALEINQNHSDPFKQKLLSDPDFRKALFYAVDRNAIAKLNQVFAAPFFLSTVGAGADDGTVYRDLPAAQALVEKYAPNGGYDPVKAKQLMDSVLNKYNVTEPVTLLMLYTETNDKRRQSSEYLQSQWEQIFDGKIKIELGAQGSALLIKTMRATRSGPVDTWDLGWSGWALAAEIFTPWKKLEKYTSLQYKPVQNGYTAYTNYALDDLCKLGYDESYYLNTDKLSQLTVQMEETMYENIPCIPVFQACNFNMFQERVELPMKQYHSQGGWAWIYSDLKDGYQ